MNLLFVVPYVPTPIRVRPYNLIRALAARGHRITLATLWTDAAERRALDDLEAWGVRVIAEPLPRIRSLRNCLRALPTATPLQAVYCWSPRLRARIEQELPPLNPPVDGGTQGGDNPPVHGGTTGGESPPLQGGTEGGERYDVVHVEHLRGAHYGLGLPDVPVVWDSVDCISHLFEQSARDSRSLAGRLMTRLDLARTRRHESWLVGQFDRVLVTSPVDRHALQRLHSPQSTQGTQSSQDEIKESAALAAVNKDDISATSAVKSDHITVLPNGVDLAYFRPGDAPREAATLVISGKMSYHANITAVHCLMEEIMPRVWARRPEVRVQIVRGAGPALAVQAKRLHPGPAFTATAQMHGGLPARRQC